MTRIALALCSALLAAVSAFAQPTFIEFESGAVRPVALSPDGSRLFVTNIPDNRLEVFNVGLGGTLTHAFSVPVGMEPVAVAPRSNSEIWVVNHLSDSVSVIDLSSTPPRVVRTLLVGDEPRDIVFAGTGGNRAFISTAHRGQHRTHTSISGVTGAGDPQLTTPGVDRADVWVFDATNLGATLGGTPVRILTFFSDTPRALATDGTTVYVAAFHSGNQTTVIAEPNIPDAFASSCGGGRRGHRRAGPRRQRRARPSAPERRDREARRRQLGRRDRLYLERDDPVHAAGSRRVPREREHAGQRRRRLRGRRHDPVQHDREPGHGEGLRHEFGEPEPDPVRGPGPLRRQYRAGAPLRVAHHGAESVGRPGGRPTTSQQAHQLFAAPHEPGANHALINAQAAHSLATPLQPVVSSNGAKLYVPAFGSAKIGVFDTADIESASFEANFDPTLESANYIPTTGGGPAGLALDETNDRLYVLTRFDNRVHAIDATTEATVQSLSLHNPEPASVVTGRQFLYDAQVSSANGEASCASCHIFGDFDSLSWNLGDPDGGVTPNATPSASPNMPFGSIGGAAAWNSFHPMKGPMTTQTLRGMATHGGMHWRGDRVSGFFGNDACNNSSPSNSPCNESLSFRNFIVAFEGLVGKQGTITPVQMQQFTDFILQVMLPPNPVRALDNMLTTAAAAGETKYFACPNAQCQFNGAGTSDTIEDCDGCHEPKPLLGFFGTAGQQTFEGEPQNAKVAHLRNMYQKIGMFGVAGKNSQVRGTGFLHDGAVPTLTDFVEAGVFNLNATEEPTSSSSCSQFPSDLAPIVGQQVTLTSTNGGVANPRIDLLIARADASFQSFMLGGTVTECDLIVKGNVGAHPAGWVRRGAVPRRLPRAGRPGRPWTDAQLRALAGTDGPLTYTCAPPGSGVRMGIDRDLDGTPDGLPEPGTVLSLAAGAALLAVLRRRRNRS